MMARIKVALNFDFETVEQFSELCGFLAKNGYKDALKELGEQLLKKAEQRDLSVSPEMIELKKQVHG